MTPRRADVVVMRARGYEEFRVLLPKALEKLGGIDIKEDKIVIKINLCDARPPETGAITHPDSLDAILWLFREYLGFDGEIYVIEGDSGVVLADQYVRWFGLLPIIERWGARWLNLTKADKKVVHVGGRVFKYIKFPKALLNGFFVSMAKLKTNPITHLTGVLKNQFGCLPIIHKMKFHPWIDQVIGDLNQALKPRLGLVDGIIAHVGTKGPAFGVPIRTNLFIMGTDPVAVDLSLIHI